MNEHEERPVITEADVTPRNIERRTFLGRFGVAVGLAGIAGLAQACGGGESASDMEGSDADQAPAPSPDSAAAAPASDADQAADADQSSDSG